MSSRGTQRRVAVLALTALSLVGVATLHAGAAPSAVGTISGHVTECGPGPIVATPGFPAPVPTPSSVILVRHRVAYATQAISFPTKPPWVGSFTFTVPAGRYEIISTYLGDVQRVFVKPGSTSDVNLGASICPQ
jgi:hypothetical protein